MKTSRDCVENFWMLRINHFLKSDLPQAEYCRQHGLKRSSMNGWISRFREKYPEKFKDRDFLIDCAVTSSKQEPPIEKAFANTENLFIEVKSKPNIESYQSEIKFIVKINNLEISFSTYPQADWLCAIVQGLK